MNGRVQTQDVEGLVEATNANGLKIAGSWCNLSQYGPRLELPEPGAHVRLAVDSKGYIREIENLSHVESPADLSSGKNNKHAIRLEVLRAAAEFVGLWGQTREDVRSEHVLVLADKWLKWVEGQ